MCLLFPWSRISPNMEWLLTEMRIAMYMCILFPWPPIFPNVEGVAERNENCNVCVCILFPWSHISQTWRGLLTKRRIALSVCVYYSFDHLFSHHGGGCWEKWELQCLCVYIIPLITYFPNMEGVAHRNENCIVCICILFLWSPISPTWKGFLTEMIIAMSARVYYSHDHLFPQHGGCCREKWELQCLCVYIIPLITYFPNMEGVAHRNENCNVCMCILFLWSPIFPSWRGMLREMRIAMSVCVYYSLDHLFPQHGGGCSQKWELHCLYMYIIPLITYFPNMQVVSHRNDNCNVCTCILFPWSHISQTLRGLLIEMKIAMPVCVYYSLDHLFTQTCRRLLT